MRDFSKRDSTLKVLLPCNEVEEVKKFISDGETPVWKYWEEFVDQSRRLGKSSVTVHSVRDGLRTLMRHLNIFTIEQFNQPKVLGGLLLDLQEKRKFSNSTRNTYIKNLNTYFIWLEKNEYIFENKIRKVQKSTEKHKEQPVLTESQIDAVVNHIYSKEYDNELIRYRNLLFVDLLRYTGARPCELLGMTRNCIYREGYRNWIIKIDGHKQKGRIRYYPCPTFIQDSYLTYIDALSRYDRMEVNLFVSISSFGGWTANGLKVFFKRLSEDLGFLVNSYGFRRFVATRLDRERVDIKDISRYLGHTRVTTTERYIERSCALTKNAGGTMAHIWETNPMHASQ